MIYIIIPVFNRKEFTFKCLKSLSHQTYKDFKVILVDDGSTDGTRDFIIKEFPEVVLLEGDGNLWWAGATNAGVEYVLKSKAALDSDYILTLNNDLEIPEDYLEILFRWALIYKKSIIGSISIDINTPDRMDFCGVEWNEFTGKYYSKAKEYSYSYPRLRSKLKVVDSDMLPGRGTLIPIRVFKEIGLYDSQNFPQYAADEDFTLKARRYGWSLIIPSNVFVKSYISETGLSLKDVHFSLKYLKDLFCSVKSPINLKVRYRFAQKNTRLKGLYFLMDLFRILLSLVRGYIFKVFRK